KSVAVLDAAGREHRLSAAKQHDVGIGHPARRRNDDLVPRIKGGHQGVVEHLLAASADGYLRGLVLKAVLPPELGDNRFLQFWNTVDIGVLRLALVQGTNGGFLDV